MKRNILMPSIHGKDIETFYNVLKVFEKRSTCLRLQVAAIIVKDKKILSTGWNGVVSGQPHCNEIHEYDIENMTYEDFREFHSEFSRLNEIHAEQNAIGHVARYGLSCEGASIFVSISPCLQCAKLIAAAGINNVYFVDMYDRQPEGINFLLRTGIGVHQINSNGQLATTFIEELKGDK